MRHIDPKIIEERKKKVLQAVIHHFIKTAKPVSSQILTEDYEIDLSSATVRNLMSELEDNGFLAHPHTSAGRVPTDKGYRSYVDSLIELQKYAIEEEGRVRGEYQGRIRELQDLLLQTSHVLSALSNYTGFVITPNIEKNQLKNIELIKIDSKRILAVLVTSTGLVKHKMIEAGISKNKLNYLNVVLNEKLKDINISLAKDKLIEILEESEREEKDVMQFARVLSGNIFSIGEEMYLDGTKNVLVLPEFKDYESMLCLLRISENKENLIKVLGENLSDEGVRVLIGSETPCSDLKNLSVISSVYKDGKNPVGVLGIIGPKRMEYSKMMSLVKSVSNIVNKLLTKFGG